MEFSKHSYISCSEYIQEFNIVLKTWGRKHCIYRNYFTCAIDCM